MIDAPEINIWDEKNSDISSRFVWAPELHNINGTWYVLVTTSRNKDNVWGIRPLMIACSKGDKDPINPDCWETDGNYCMPFENDSKAFANFSLDMTYFEAGGKHYVIWAEIDGFSNLRIASIDPNEPWKMTSPDRKSVV